MALDIETIVDGLYFPECLRWRQGQLWYSDMLRGTVGAWSEGKTRTVVTLADDPGGLGWLPSGELLVVGMRRCLVHRLDHHGNLRIHADLRPLIEHPANDMYVDRKGRAFIGSYGFDVDNGAPVEAVQLLVVAPSGSVSVRGEHLVFPNGIDERRGSQSQHRELVVSETFADRVSTVALGPDGSLGPRRTLATLAPGDGPDGLSVDSEGGVWVGCAYGEKVVHLTREGELDEVVTLSGMGAVCCVLGGPGRQTLYVAAVGSVRDEAYAAQHPTGSILAIDLNR